MALTLFNDPFMTEMDRTMNRMMTGFGMPMFGGDVGRARGTGMPTGEMNVFQPFTGVGGGNVSIPMDIIETPTDYELHADTPGFTPDDVKVELHEGVLTVRGGRKTAREDKDTQGKVWRCERSSINFVRSFTLPDNANGEGICASMDCGVLKVCVPKMEPTAKPEPKRIAITGGHGGTSTVHTGTGTGAGMGMGMGTGTGAGMGMGQGLGQGMGTGAGTTQGHGKKK